MNSDTTVLFAEDDDGHAALIEENLRQAGMGEALSSFEGWAGSLGVFPGFWHQATGKNGAPISLAS